MKKLRRRTIVITGILLNVEGRYVCWNSFRSDWYLGPKRLSEIFPVTFEFLSTGKGSAQLEDARDKYPSATASYAR